MKFFSFIRDAITGTGGLCYGVLRNAYAVAAIAILRSHYTVFTSPPGWQLFRNREGTMQIA